MTHSVEMLDAQAEEAIKAVGIPPCPAVLTQVIREIRSDEPDFGRMGKLIGGDVALAGAMLHTVNSPFYGLQTAATSVRQALTVIGLVNASQLVTRLLLRQAFLVGTNTASENLVMEHFWDSSAHVAALSARIAKSLKAADADLAHTFGLFRNCGMAVLLRRHKDYAKMVDDAALGAERLTEVENDRYGTNHAHVGAVLARSWLLPEPLCLAVLHHHNNLEALSGRYDGVGTESIQLIAVAAVAEKVYLTAAGGVVSSEVELAASLAAARLGVDDEGLTEFADLAEAA